jgi:hypothetical protein
VCARHCLEPRGIAPEWRAGERSDSNSHLVLRQIQEECTPDLLFEVVILTLERSEGEGSLYFVFVLSHMRQGTPTLILL